MGFLRQECWSGLSFPSPVDHILSELSTMTCQSWVALHGMAHSFIELDKVWSMWSDWLVFCWKITEVQSSVSFNLLGNEGEGVYGKVIFDLNLEISVEHWEVNMLGKVPQFNITGLCGNSNAWAGCINRAKSSVHIECNKVINAQFSSFTQSCPTLCDPMNCSTPDLLVQNQLPEFT